MFILDLSSLENGGSATPPDGRSDYTLVAAIFGTFGAVMLLAVTLAIVIAVLTQHRNSRKMKIHVDPRDMFVTPMKANGQVQPI